MAEIQETYRNIGRATILIVILSIIGKIVALVKEAVVAAKFGTSWELDAFNIAYAYPAILILFLSGAMTAAFVPLYVGWKQKSELEANNNTTILFHIFSLVFILLTIISYFLAPQIYKFFGFGFNQSQKVLCILLAKILVFLILLDGIAILPLALIHARKKFLELYVANNLPNVIIIGFLFFFYEKLKIYALAWGFIVGTLIKLLYSIFIIYRENTVSLVPQSRNFSSIKTFSIFVIPLLGSEMIANLNIFVDQIMATSLEEGSVSTLRYAYRINDIPIQIVILSISQAIFPFISEQALEDTRYNMKETFKTSVVLVALLTLPITFLVFLYARDMVEILFQRGAFDENSTVKTADTLICYSIGLFFYGYSFVNGRFFVAMRQERLLLLVGIISLILNVVFNLIFMHFWGVKGIALSTSATIVIITTFFVVLLHSKMEFKVFRDVGKNLLRILLACFIMYLLGLISKSIEVSIRISHILYTMLSVGVLCIVYLAVIYFVKSSEISTCINILAKIIFKRRGINVL